MKPILSFCVPFYGTQEFLSCFLESIRGAVASFRDMLPIFIKERFCAPSSYESSCLIEQSVIDSLLEVTHAVHPLFELIIVDDGTESREDWKVFSKIIKQYKTDFLKKYSIKIIVEEHSKNMGLVEARRSAILVASGEWCAFLDSDDEIAQNAILHLLCNAYFFDADIVQGKADMICDFPCEEDAALYNSEKLEVLKNLIQKVHLGVVEKENILKDFLLDRGHSGFLWGKVFKTEVVKKSFEIIPRCYCVMSEDFLIYFFILLNAKKYIGIDAIVYKYFVGRGISGNKEICSIDEWRRCCTAGTTFAIIFDYLAENNLGDDIEEALQQIASSHLFSNIRRLKRVAPSLKDEAHRQLEEYWSFDMVREAEAFLAGKE